MPRTTTRARLAPALLAGGLLVFPLTGCTGSGDTGSSGTETTTAAGTTTATTPQSSAPTDSGVDCSGTRCSVTLTGQDSTVEVLGTTVGLQSSENGRATFRVGDQEISCSQGESVSAGPLTLECTTVTADSVTFSASLG
ncbi:hypothetical protein DQ238_04145 [Geodermatophilus sp. TF02-6]|uniref:hypothetical protein n=1 Tax=Geodermatophilus sp. TF02-6 TaxID=2250575 RepID=UPI000DEA22A2|nr:hypothetical protein [Geodermatophilus sp. TF02-6]RBY82489.1 hypothetical protein DQ238_04145 [Geodermatophilus sp. TF02-6]